VFAGGGEEEEEEEEEIESRGMIVMQL